jgi:DNA-directed RNA polymerase specialized sigma24 family protein
MDGVEAEFVDFARMIEPGLRIALVASHGVDRGLEATNDALVYAWRHWDRVRSLDNPGGYLYRVGQRRALRRRLVPRMPWAESASDGSPWVEPRLSSALMALSPRQRQVVVLIESYEWTQREVAELLGIGLSSVQTHLERGLERLRVALGVSDVE